MRIAGLQLGVIKTLAAVCAFFFASTFGANIAEAISDPVTQAASSEDANSTVVQMNSELNSANVSDEQSKGKRKSEALRIRRQAVLHFLEHHFPELRESLLKSEKKSPRKSRIAIKQIERDIIFLQKVKQNQPGKFELAVEQWRLKTQIEITIAKYAKKETDEQLKSRLKPLVDEMLDVRKSILEFDRQTTSNRLDRIDKLLLNLETSRERAAANRLRLFQMSIDEIRAIQKMKQKNSKTTSNKDHLHSEETP